MLVLQTVTLCLALCIFTLQAKYSYGESITSNIALPSVTLNDKWQEYGCQTNPKLDKPFGKLQLCLGTVINQMIFRILQNYSPTPLPEHLIISGARSGFEGQIHKYIETYLPHVSTDKNKVQHVFDQVNEYIFTPLIKYLDQFPMEVLTSDEQEVIEARRKDIANILKKYMKEPLNPVVPVTANSFQENLPAIIRYLARYAPDITANLDVLTLLLHRIKKDGFKETTARDLSKLPKEEVIFEGIEPNNAASANIDGLDKGVLLKFVERYYPEQFGDQAFIDVLVQKYDAQPKSNVVVTSEPDNDQIKRALLYFFKTVYPDLQVDEESVDKFTEDFIPNRRSHVESSEEAPESDTATPTREEILEYVKAQLRLSTDSTTDNISTNVPATSPVPEVEYIPVPSRRIQTENLPEDPSVASLINEASEPEPIEEFGQTPTPAEAKTIRQKILDCIKEKYPQVYENKPVLAKIIKDIESNILADEEEPPMILEKQMRRFRKAYVPFIAAGHSDSEEEDIEIGISPETKQSSKTVENIYVGRGLGRGKLPVSKPQPGANAIHTEEHHIEVDVTQEHNQPRKTFEKVYVSDDGSRTAKVSLSHGKIDQNAALNVQVNGDNVRKAKHHVKLHNNINFKYNNPFGKISKEQAQEYKNEYAAILKSFQDNVLRHKQDFKPAEIEMRKGKDSPAAAARLKQYMAGIKQDKSGKMEYPNEPNFFPLMMRTYGPLFEKEFRGGTLTKEERLKMHILETMFEKSETFRERYLEKMAEHDKVGFKGRLYNMFKELTENRGKTVRIDPMTSVKPHVEILRDEHEENQIEPL